MSALPSPVDFCPPHQHEFEGIPVPQVQAQGHRDTLGTNYYGGLINMMKLFSRVAYFARREVLIHRVDTLVVENEILRLRLDMAKARTASLERALSNKEGAYHA